MIGSPRPWTEEELTRLDEAFSIVLAAVTADGPPTGSVEIGIVVLGKRAFVRAYRGRVSGWYQATEARGHGTIRAADVVTSVLFEAVPTEERLLLHRIDEAYRAKYRELSSGIATEVARAATVEILPIVAP